MPIADECPGERLDGLVVPRMAFREACSRGPKLLLDHADLPLRFHVAAVLALEAREPLLHRPCVDDTSGGQHRGADPKPQSGPMSGPRMGTTSFRLR